MVVQDRKGLPLGDWAGFEQLQNPGPDCPLLPRFWRHRRAATGGKGVVSEPQLS